MHPEQTGGALGTLSWLADRVQVVGEWQLDDDISESLSIQENPAEAAEEFMEYLGSDPDDSVPYVIDRRYTLDIIDVAEIFQRNSLKNKELAYAPTQPDFVEVEEEELEMA
jgi:hypothetical protein